MQIAGDAGALGLHGFGEDGGDGPAGPMRVALQIPQRLQQPEIVAHRGSLNFAQQVERGVPCAGVGGASADLRHQNYFALGGK